MALSPCKSTKSSCKLPKWRACKSEGVYSIPVYKKYGGSSHILSTWGLVHCQMLLFQVRYQTFCWESETAFGTCTRCLMLYSAQMAGKPGICHRARTLQTPSPCVCQYQCSLHTKIILQYIICTHSTTYSTPFLWQATLPYSTGVLFSICENHVGWKLCVHSQQPVQRERI